MGKAYSHFNVWALSTIVSARESDVLELMNAFQKDQEAKGTEITNTTVLLIEEKDFLRRVKELDQTDSDIDILINIFHLLDLRGIGDANLKDLLICFSILTVRSVKRCFELSLQLFDRVGQGVIQKHELAHVLKLLNDTCYYFGDNYLSNDQLHDLIDSLYTSVGKIDGEIYYPDFLDFLADHPIIEMFMSPQFQGSVQGKVLTDEQIEIAVRKQK